MLVVYCIGLALALVVWCGDFVWFGCVSGVGVVVDLVWWRLVVLGCYVRLVFWFPCLVGWFRILVVHLCFHGFASSGVVDFMVVFWRVVWGSVRRVSGDLF